MAPFGALGPEEDATPIAPVDATIILAGRLDEPIVEQAIAIIERHGGTIVSNVDERATGTGGSRSTSETPLSTI